MSESKRYVIKFHMDLSKQKSESPVCAEINVVWRNLKYEDVLNIEDEMIVRSFAALGDLGRKEIESGKR